MADELVELERLMREAFLGNIHTTVSQPTPTSALNSFKFKPLTSATSIRLIELKAGYGAATLHVSLLEYPLEHSPRFEALSYVWGDTRRVCNVVAEGSLFPITKSLHEALLRLRRITSDRLLFADSICINQDDNDEKSKQVFLMPEIYRRAQHVLCWLGEDDSTQSAWRTVQLIERIGTVDFGPLRDVEDKAAWKVEQGFPQRGDRAWFRYMDFWCRPYFRRRWIIPEVANAQVAILVIGHRQVRLNNLVGGMNHTLEHFSLEEYITGYARDYRIEEKRIAANDSILTFQSIVSLNQPDDDEIQIEKLSREVLAMDDEAIEQMPSARFIEESGMTPVVREVLTKKTPIFNLLKAMLPPEAQRTAINTGIQIGLALVRALNRSVSRIPPCLPDLLDEFVTTEASDPRDRLFAILSLSSDAKNLSLKPDYGELPIQVLMRYASFFIEQEEVAMKLLSAAGLAYRVKFLGRPPSITLDSLPSWVPDWLSSRSKASLILMGHEVWTKALDGQGFFNASGRTKPAAHLLPDKTTLSVRGSIFDTVTCVVHGFTKASKDIRGILAFWDRADALIAEKYLDYPFSDLPGHNESIEQLQRRALTANYETRFGISEQIWGTSYQECRAYLKHMGDVMELYDHGLFAQNQLTQILQATRRDDIPVVMDDYFNRWAAMSATHDLVGTRRGLIGHVPHGTAVGDAVTLLNGASTPFIIREANSTTGTHTSQGQTAYQLVGGAYMHGIMQGEVVGSSWWKEEDIALI